MSRAAAALIAAATLVRAGVRSRRGRIGRRKVAAWTALAAALGVYAAGAMPPLPDPERVLGGLAGSIGVYAYPLVGGVAYLETAAFAGLVTPGEFTLLLGGVVAARGDIAIVPLVGIVWLCSMLGDSTGYLLGRRLGRSFLERHGDRFHVGRGRLERVERFFDRRGGLAVFTARFLGPMRTLAPFVAGSSRMPYRRFFPYSVLSTGLWSTFFCLLGYFFYSSFARVAELAGRTGGVLAATVVVVAVAVYAYRRRHPGERRRLHGPARFLLERLTPGGLGIELTSALASAAVGLYVFGFYVSLFAPTPDLVTPLDGLARSVAGVLPRGLLAGAAGVITEAGSSVFTGALVLVGALWLAFARRWAEAVALAAGFALLSVSVNLAKAMVDRPRPAGALVAGEDPSYPSGHASYAVIYVALALIVGRRVHGAAGSAVLVLGGVAVAILLGLSRVYLGAHHLSDVSGGWGLGTGVLGACAAVAILVGHLAPSGTPAGGTTLPDRGTQA